MIVSLDKKFEPKSTRYPILCNFVRSSHLGDYLVFDMDSSAKPLHCQETETIGLEECGSMALHTLCHYLVDYQGVMIGVMCD